MSTMTDPKLLHS